MKRISIVLISLLVMIEGASADEGDRGRMLEAKHFPELQAAERSQEANIREMYRTLNRYGPLARTMGKDSVAAFQDTADPLHFKKVYGFVSFTPTDTFARYVRETPDFVFAELGEPKTILDLISHGTRQAKGEGLVIPGLQLQNREGIELTRFQFLYRQTSAGKQVIGSHRRSLLLFFKPGSSSALAPELDLVVMRISEVQPRDAIKHLEVIIDPSPLSASTEGVIRLNRYNTGITTCDILATFENNPGYPQRLKFKKDFHAQLLEQFNVFYDLVDNYALLNSKKQGEKTLDGILKSMN